MHIDPSILAERNEIAATINKGEFWKPCPGTTKGYHCCGYQILTPLTGCGMYCAYCVLQAYLECQKQVVFENFPDLENEVRSKLASHAGIVRFGTGEFGDSLFLEERLHLSQKIAALLDPYPNVLVEFKTKSKNVDGLRAVKTPAKVVIGFSLNTPEIIGRYEEGTASLDERLAAAWRCLDMGFWIAFHFDPIIRYPDWERDYRDLVKRIFSSVRDHRRIAWWSMGGFRTPAALKTLLKKQNRHLPLFSGEMVLGEDGKYRYFRPLRVELYRAIGQEIFAAAPGTCLYLCMESPEVWEASDMNRLIPDGLVRFLDKRAEEMLSETSPRPAATPLPQGEG
jgi:spore photoproduct lyase